MTRLFIGFLLLSSSIYAQDFTEKELSFIENTEQAEDYLKNNKTKNNKLITFNQEKHKTTLAKELFDKGNHGVVVKEGEFKKTYYKIVERNEVPHYRVGYIYLDGSKINPVQINSIRNKIIEKYKKGISFKDLAQQYSMDGNASRGGDLGWFAQGEMHPDFENAVINSDQSQDIFTLDIASKQWYYVILRTHNSKPITEIKVLKIVEAS